VLKGEVLPGCVRRDVSVKDHLVEHVAEFLEEPVAVCGLDRVDELVALFDEVLHERFVGLLGVPRASARRPKAMQYSDEFFELRIGRRHALILPSALRSVELLGGAWRWRRRGWPQPRSGPR